MSGDLITTTQAAANRAKTHLSKLLQSPSSKDELMLPSARQRLQTMESEPTSDELAGVLLGIGKFLLFLLNS